MSREQQNAEESKKRPRDDDTDVLPAGRCVHVSERYEKLGRLGEGTYGIVYKARDKKTNQIVALKRCIPHHESSDGFPITTLREIESLKVCSSHPNVVHLEQVAVSKSGVFLVFEYCEHDLADLIDAHYSKYRKSPFDQAASKRLIMQLLDALSFLHAHSKLHRDVKLSNLLYQNNSGQLKLADFGLSRSYASSHIVLTPKVASLWYRPPELLLGATRYSEAIDLWASGCIFCEFLKGVPLMSAKTEMDQIQKIFDCLGVPTVREWPSLNEMPLIRDGSLQPRSTSRRCSILDDFAFLGSSGLRFLTSLLQYDPEKRWSAKQALDSPYFQEDPLPTPTSRMPRFHR